MEVTMMAKDKFSYEIVENLGSLTQEVDLHPTWCKNVLKTLLNSTDSGIDIRNMNIENNNLGKGIRLTIQEANNLVDILLQNGYGSNEVIESEYKKRQSLFQLEAESVKPDIQ